MSQKNLKPYTVIYAEPGTKEFWQFFECMAEDDDHAEEQATNSDSKIEVLWINEGHGPASQTMED